MWPHRRGTPGSRCQGPDCWTCRLRCCRKGVHLAPPARSGDRITIAACLGRGHAFDRALTYFAEKCADRNDRDHRAFADAVHMGRLRSAGDA
ncbi:DUF2252 family protein [Streptomyces sp. NPDC059153]|uniref:DUF2252 family protein n=1 Tax=Streptomyces sp. NPDC059153 TaxID=3346743 RepID=UPI0036BFD607